jgi:hypothetical protein
MTLQEHPTVRNLSTIAAARDGTQTLDRAWLRRLALTHGAHDAGLVEIASPALESQRAEILRNYRWTRSLLSFVVRMAREPVRGAPRSVANLGFQRAGEQVTHVGAVIVARSGAPCAAILMPLGFFVSSTSPRVTEPTRMISLVYAGAGLLAIGMLLLVSGSSVRHFADMLAIEITSPGPPKVLRLVQRAAPVVGLSRLQ